MDTDAFSTASHTLKGHQAALQMPMDNVNASVDVSGKKKNRFRKKNKDKSSRSRCNNGDNNGGNYSDVESVDPEVKELIRGREKLTFGAEICLLGKPHLGGNSASAAAAAASNIGGVGGSNELNSLSYNDLTSSINYTPAKLVDAKGNVFQLHPSGYVTPYKQAMGHIGGYSNIHYVQPVQQRPIQMQMQMQMQMPQQRPLQFYPIAPEGYNSTTHTSSSVSSMRKRNKAFQNLNTSLFAKNRLKLVQQNVLCKPCFFGDIDLSTSNRFGDLDSTTRIMSSSANTSLRSSYRNSLRSSFASTTRNDNRSTKLPPTSNDEIKVDEVDDEIKVDEDEKLVVSDEISWKEGAVAASEPMMEHDIVNVRQDEDSPGGVDGNGVVGQNEVEKEKHVINTVEDETMLESGDGDNDGDGKSIGNVDRIDNDNGNSNGYDNGNGNGYCKHRDGGLTDQETDLKKELDGDTPISTDFEISTDDNSLNSGVVKKHGDQNGTDPAMIINDDTEGTSENSKDGSCYQTEEKDRCREENSDIVKNPEDISEDTVMN